ncbi:MAG: hypothetical protein IJH84_18430 [Saccharopolyspora sp.]|uniref:hypothetical protein n=1 Tax=Saccharopolyspora sp. TaxID=33915 RepID=UPI0025CBA48F|nr:hypothetical protein [Saccharopolyspora sp.]MBQ6642994.1 hypothetical protein [Saccharopolyspora sp.]
MNVRIDPTTLAALAGDLEGPNDNLANTEPRNRYRQRRAARRPWLSLRRGR